MKPSFRKIITKSPQNRIREHQRLIDKIVRRNEIDQSNVLTPSFTICRQVQSATSLDKIKSSTQITREEISQSPIKVVSDKELIPIHSQYKRKHFDSSQIRIMRKSSLFLTDMLKAIDKEKREDTAKTYNMTEYNQASHGNIEMKHDRVNLNVNTVKEPKQAFHHRNSNFFRGFIQDSLFSKINKTREKEKSIVIVKDGVQRNITAWKNVKKKSNSLYDTGAFNLPFYSNIEK
jgi:hypothetical protein